MRNLAKKIDKYLPQQLLGLVQDIRKQTIEQGYNVYFVGGIVRDMILDYPSFDVDLVVEGDAVKLAKQVAAVSPTKLLVHHRFGTAKLKYDNFTIDLATARKETYTRPGALPAVTRGTLKDDLFRRDFTINAMAISLAYNNYGELIDPYNGESDMEHHLIRILHADSFNDDATRILRGICYEQRFRFEFEIETACLLKRNIPMLDSISGDRIRHELEHIFEEKRPELVIKRLDELGVLYRIFPSLKGNAWIAEKFDKARGLEKPNQLPSLYFSLLIYSFGEREIEWFLERLNIPAKLSRVLRDTLKLKAGLSLLDKPSLRPSQIYYLLQEYEHLAIQVNAIATESVAIHRNLQLFLTKLRHVRTSLDGEELKELGICAGPEMGKIMRILHRAKLDGDVRTRSDERNLALFAKAIDFNAESES